MNNDRQEESRSSTRGRAAAPGNGDGLVARTHEGAEKLKDLAEERASRFKEGVESAKEQAAKRIRKLGVAVRAIGENMRIDDEQFVADYADSASQRLDSVATYLTDHDAGDVVRDAEDLMRRKPAMAYFGAFLAGLAAGRFLRSSPPSGSAEVEAHATRPRPRKNSSRNGARP